MKILGVQHYGIAMPKNFQPFEQSGGHGTDGDARVWLDPDSNPNVLKKFRGGKPAKERHGVKGWWNGHEVTYYEHLGWFRVDECVAYAAAEHRNGAVFASRYCYVPTAEVEGNGGGSGTDQSVRGHEFEE